MGTTPMQSSPNQILEITVIDTNDNPPRFLQNGYHRNIPESTSVGQFVVEVQAKDDDLGLNAKIVYGLVNGTQYFHIRNETGLFIRFCYHDIRPW